MKENGDSNENNVVQDSSLSQAQEYDSQDRDDPLNPGIRPTCPSCGKTGTRKRYMRCAICSRHWHMTCVRLTKAQANALCRWWCPDCVKSELHVSAHSTEASQRLTLPAPPQSEPDAVGTDVELGLTLARLRRSRPVVRRIPKGARISAADALVTLIEKAVATSDLGPWSKLLRFPYEVLCARGEATKQSLTTKIKQHIAEYMATLSDPSAGCFFHQETTTENAGISKSHDHKKKGMSCDKLKRNVGLKLSDGDVKGAIRLLSSADTVAQDSTKTIEALRVKHPPAPEDTCLPSAPDESTQPLLASCADVEAAIKSFSSGSSAGLDGLRPSHLRDLTGYSCGEAGRRLINALTSLVNLALLGKIPPAARDAFFTASLLALEKPCGGIRPIAIGSTYRRLATKVALRPLSSEIGEKLRPAQLGFGTNGGCEAAAHATRHFVNLIDGEDVVVKIDMRNAFNSIRRDHLLSVVRDLAPSLYPLLWQAYSSPTPLYHGTTRIMSATGVQQGDPCGPAVFALATHSVISATTCSMNTWFLDDGTLGGNVADVCSDLEKLIPAMVRIGLHVNPSKCQIIAPVSGNPQTIDKLHRFIPGASVLTEDQKTVLGAPLTPAATEASVSEKREDLMRMLERLKKLDAHSALYLLRNSLWLPKLQYLLRAAPIFQHSSLLKELDEAIREAMEELINVRFSDTNWEQAVLPTRLGGLGLRRTEDVALPSFIASLHRCQQLLHTILPSSFGKNVTEERKQAEDEWCKKAGDKTAPEDEARVYQRSWDSPIAEHLRDCLLLEANQFDRARILGAAASESGAWLRAIPSAGLGLHLDNNTVRIAVALRVGADVCSGVHACRCGSTADVKGHHALTCQFSAGRIPRHTALNDIVRRALLSAGVPAQLEPYGVDRGDGKRPDGMSIFPFSHGRCLVWDATCVNTFADSRLGDAALKAGAAAKEAEIRKRRKYSQLAQRFRFEPIAFESDGACGPTTKSFIRELGARMSAVSGDSRETEWLLQRFSIAVVRGNAVSILLDRPAVPLQPEQRGGMKPSPLAPATSGLHQGLQDHAKPSRPCQSMSPACTSGRSRAAADGGVGRSDGNASSGDHGQDPLYIGLTNNGNKCYQNAALQSLLGLQPFMYEMMALGSGPDGESCRTLHAVVKLMVLRNKALGKSVSSYLKDLRVVFGRIDPTFCGNEMQDAGEFLLRLLDTIKEESDASLAPANPVRENFEYQTVDSYTCTKCHESVLKRQESISWFVNVPRSQSSGTPSLQDALRLSLRSDRRELHCQHCNNDVCHVSTKVRKLPRTLIVQLNRYAFLGEEAKKVRANVEIPKFLSLDEHVADDAMRPRNFSSLRLSLSAFPEEGDELERPKQPEGLSPRIPETPTPAAKAPDNASLHTPARPSSPLVAAPVNPTESASVVTPLPLPPPPPPSPTPLTQTTELVNLDADSANKPARTREDEEQDLPTRKRLARGEPADVPISTAEQAHLSELCIGDDQLLRSNDRAGANTYRLVGLVSHYGGATHSGHYVSEVFSVTRDQWYHYDDRNVSIVDEEDVLGDVNRRDGYIFFYMQKELCSRAETDCAP